MAAIEKGQLAGAGLIPNAVLSRNDLESKSPQLNLQVLRLTRRCAISAAMAAILAPHIFGEGAR